MRLRLKGRLGADLVSKRLGLGPKSGRMREATAANDAKKAELRDARLAHPGHPGRRAGSPGSIIADRFSLGQAHYLLSMSMFLSRLFLLATISMTALSGCGRKGEEAAPAMRADSAAVQPPDSARSFPEWIAERYGSRVHNGDTLRDSSGSALHWPCVKARIALHGEPHVLLAMCTERVEAAHVESGLVDLFLLRGTDESLVLAADSTGIESGSSGNPGDVSLLHLGRDLWGVQIVGGYLGQGNYSESTSWMATDGVSFNGLLDYSSTESNEGDCGDDSASPCTSWRRWVLPDSSDAAASVYPVVVRDTLVHAEQLRTRETRVAFDATTRTWPLPAALETPGRERE